jgi:transposase
MQSEKLLADRAYDAEDRVLMPLSVAGKIAVIPQKKNRKKFRSHDKWMYQARHLIENFFAKLKQYRAIATRYDKLAQNFLSGVYLAAAIIWLN